ncbi:Costars family protein [Morella rubra]|uniref:Costars family protein n=1 Tax=Morella rubra TaxID=262757 RepID=A0A6A1V1Z7_9ROSI|nr:Costars family protein [Morella rubra]
MNVEEEVERLKEEIKRLGKVQDDGSYKMGDLTVQAFLFVSLVLWYAKEVRTFFVFFALGLHFCLRVTFGVLFNDDKCANMFEALVGTLRAGKKRKLLTYDGELLLQGVHDNVEIILKPTPAAVAVATDAAGVRS